MNEREEETGQQSSSGKKSSLALKMPVFSNDGYHLGHVQRIDSEQRQFQLNAPGKPDYWLDLATIDTVRSGYALLRINRSEADHRGHVGADRSGPLISPLRRGGAGI